MPHKHKRKRGDEGDYELPPSQRAAPLQVRPNRVAAPIIERKKRGKNKREANDIPRGFRRVMAAASGHKMRSGLDDGQVPKKPKKAKGKGDTAADSTTTAVGAGPAAMEIPRIRPGEDLRAFAARVDAALPVTGLTRKTIVKDGKDEQGVKVWKTRKERQMHKLYDQWHAEERKIQDQREEQMELEAERELEKDGEGITSTKYWLDEDPDKVKKKKRGGGGGGGDNKKDDDPWAILKKKRGEGRIGLHDTAQAPPELNKSKTRQLKMVHGGAGADVEGIPKSAGSLRRREQLQEERTEVLEAYRKIREHEQAKLAKKK